MSPVTSSSALIKYLTQASQLCPGPCWKYTPTQSVGTHYAIKLHTLHTHTHACTQYEALFLYHTANMSSVHVVVKPFLIL